jgi:hypothetical protein
MPAANGCGRVVGKWRWFTNSTHEFRADGSMNGSPTSHWTCVDAARGVIVVSWASGKYVDTLVLSADGRSLEGKNQYGHRVWGKR